MQHQWAVNGGKCGICGDPYDGPRDHEAGGKYATGTIVRYYRVGQVMPVLIQLTGELDNIKSQAKRSCNVALNCLFIVGNLQNYFLVKLWITTVHHICERRRVIANRNYDNLAMGGTMCSAIVLRFRESPKVSKPRDWVLNLKRMVMKFDRRLCSFATEEPVKFHRGRTNLNPYISVSRIHVRDLMLRRLTA